MLKLYLKFLRYLKPHWLSESAVLLLSITTSAFMLVNPYVLKVLIDDALVPKNMDLLVNIMYFVIALAIVGGVVGFMNTYYYNLVSNKIMLDIRSSIFNHIIFLPQSFFIKQKSGDLVQKINNEVDIIRSFITKSLLTIIKNTIMVVALVTALCYLNAKLFFASIVTFPLMWLALRYFQPKIKKIMEEVRKKDSTILSFFIERFQYIKLIQIYNIYKDSNSKLKNHLNDRIDLDMRRVKWSALNSSVISSLFSANMLIIFIYGGYLIINNALTLGGLLAFLNYLMLLLMPVREFQSLYMEIIRVSVSMERIDDILQVETIEEKQNGNCQPFQLEKNLSFENVSFKYNGKTVLDKINFNLEKGKSYAIVGASGSGKTTIINLLLKFVEPNSGQIYVDDKPLENIDVFNLRNNISVMSQESQLFDDSIIENIRIGNMKSSTLR